MKTAHHVVTDMGTPLCSKKISRRATLFTTNGLADLRLNPGPQHMKLLTNCLRCGMLNPYPANVENRVS
jgi:hypothetical protein